MLERDEPARHRPVELVERRIDAGPGVHGDRQQRQVGGDVRNRCAWMRRLRTKPSMPRSGRRSRFRVAAAALITASLARSGAAVTASPK